MNARLDDLMYQAGLTAQGCWDEMDSYDREAILKFAELIVQECLEILNVKEYSYQNGDLAEKIKQHFGVEE